MPVLLTFQQDKEITATHSIVRNSLPDYAYKKDKMNYIILALLLAILLFLLAGATYGYRSLKRISRRLNDISKEVAAVAPFVWATNSLARRNDLITSLPNWNGWSMPPDTLVHILDTIEARKPTCIVEFGAGISTVLIASQLKRTQGKLISYEHDAVYAKHILSMLQIRGLDDVVDIRVHAMTAEKFMSYDHSWYDLDTDTLPTNADLVIVDGPPQAFGAKVRLPAGDLMATRMAPGGSILFDDAARDGEQAIKRVLMDKYAGFRFVEPPSIRGLLIMTRAD